MNRDDESNYTVRPLTIDDIDQYNALLRYAFQVTEQELSETGWKNDEIKRSKFPVLQRADVLGCFDGERSCVAVRGLPAGNEHLQREVYPVGFVTSVCTYPEYTGHGIMKRLMLQSLDGHAREKAVLRAAVSLLDTALPPSRLGDHLKQDFIHRKGQADTAQKRRRPVMYAVSSGRTRDFMDLHAKFAPMTHGCLYRNCACLGGILALGRGRHEGRGLLLGASDEPCGYMVYLINRRTSCTSRR